jgi:glycosyltransferase involved in cell wall biosynthesis
MPIETLKILHVIARFNIGGTARYLEVLVPELEAKNVDIKLLVGRIQLGEVEDSSLAGLNFERIESLGRRISLIPDIKSYFEIRRVVKDFEPDLIHTHTFKAGMICRLMHFRIPKVHTFHGHLLTDPEFLKYQIRVIVFIERILATLSRKLIVTGESVATDLLTRGVGKPDKYVSIPGESRHIDFLPRKAAREKLGLNNEFVVLWLARVVPVKNPRLLIQVSKRLPDCKFLMAGDGIELDSIIGLAPPNLKILGFVNPKEVMMAADVFISTSLNEGIPYAILEAQSAHLPVVAVNAGAVSEIIKEGVNGYLVNANAEEIVNKIQQLKSNPELLERMRFSYVESFSTNQSKMSFSDKHVALYREILNKF